jgi:hypothetical protein
VVRGAQLNFVSDAAHDNGAKDDLSRRAVVPHCRLFERPVHRHFLNFYQNSVPIRLRRIVKIGILNVSNPYGAIDATHCLGFLQISAVRFFRTITFAHDPAHFFTG